MATRGSHDKLLQKLWHLAEELQLNPQDLGNEMWLSKYESWKLAWQMAVEGRQVELLEKLSDWTK
jgi:hypothetical protein